ncbi:neutral zinc metallopeptidase [Bacillus sp. FJAT-49711]|uniref:KPN_02809 family neutral zinc metallopeptidase n=1 Tax=Bacillus sp. FJAT-49711 TaxID=2833585 RepID=UPI001BC97476|nr:neutral zinc metallopeptidase [Bacillus sp. FJAT-49711]MBS4218552.1 neutral zinc metallopeptidase [Bacillus sp. FJAT-49711]
MKWEGRRGSANIEDKRGKGGTMIAGGGIGSLILLLVFTFLGGDPGSLLQGVQPQGYDNPPPYEETAKEKELSEFVSVVLADTEDVWSEIFKENGLEYKNPILVLYTDSVQSACGAASSAVGPFYCPGDQKLYIDLSFYDELQQRFNAPGDFAMAYVIAHEVGHHVQKLLGTSDQVAALRQKLSEKEYNKYSVRLELQADYYAGVWANHAESLNILDDGDIAEAIKAASAVGDDTLQKQARGYVVPESFTHGTSEQRMRWFKKGYQSGDLDEGDTFNTQE